jgi:hypothetical protein
MTDAKSSTALYEPCARIDGGINILRNGVTVWESFWNGYLINGVFSDEARWKNALLLCDALALIEKATS